MQSKMPISHLASSMRPCCGPVQACARLHAPLPRVPGTAVARRWQPRRPGTLVQPSAVVEVVVAQLQHRPLTTALLAQPGGGPGATLQAQGVQPPLLLALPPQPLLDLGEGLETPIQLIYLTALLGFLAAGAYLVVRQVLIRRELDEAAKGLGERIRTGEATCEVGEAAAGARLRRPLRVCAVPCPSPPFRGVATATRLFCCEDDPGSQPAPLLPPRPTATGLL